MEVANGDAPEPNGLEEDLVAKTLPPSLGFLLASEAKPPDCAKPAKPPPVVGVAVELAADPPPKTLLFAGPPREEKPD